MNIKPSENTKLFGLNHYFNEIITLYNVRKMPSRILLSGKSGSGKSTLAFHVINYILSINEELKYDEKNFQINNINRSYKLIQNNSHPNFYLIDILDDKKNIDVEQIRRMIVYTNKYSFNNSPRFILIDNIENLNKNSVNSLLKILEEPNKNIFFILIHNNEKKILSTLKSRCLMFKINLSFEESINISNLLINDDIFKIINYDLINYYFSPGEFINLINFAEEKKIKLKEYNLIKFLKLLIDNSYYKKNKFVKKLIINYIELYFLKAYKLSNASNSLLSTYRNFLYKIHNNEIFNLDDETLFFEFKSKFLNE